MTDVPELLPGELSLDVHEVWTGAASSTREGGFELDPWHELPIRSIHEALVQRFDFTMLYGRALRTY